MVVGLFVKSKSAKLVNRSAFVSAQGTEASPPFMQALYSRIN